MKLTFKRQAKNKKRFSIFDENEEYLFSVSEYTYFKENLSEETHINDEDELKRLKARCDSSEFMNYALNILSRHIYTKKSLKEKLRQKGCGDEVAAAIINELSEKKILSDDAYKENYIYEAQTYKKNGIRRIKQELYFKGITAENEDFDKELELSNLNELTEALINSGTDEKKIIAKLTNKGYNISDIISAIKNFKNTDIEYYE